MRSNKTKGPHLIPDSSLSGNICKIQLTLVISTSLISNNRYLEVKIWSLPKDKNLITGNKILWKRGGAISPHFHNIFNIVSLISRVQLHIHMLNVVVRFIFSSVLLI